MNDDRVRCDLCGKFRKKDESFNQLEHDSDGNLVADYTECIWCMSQSDLERYRLKRPKKIKNAK